MEQTLTIQKQDAITAMKKADKSGKELLKNLFGNQLYENITDRVKTFEDACEVLGVKPKDVVFECATPALQQHERAIQAFCKLIIIAKALNEGWLADLSDSSQPKYYPWFEHKAGFGLSYYVYVHWHSATTVGVRLCYKSAALAEYAGRQFLPEYTDFITLQS